MPAAFTDVQTLHAGARYTVVRAHAPDGTSVIVKRVESDRPELRAAERLRHEHDLLRALDVPGVPRALALTALDGRPALVLEDVGARSLADELLAGPLSIDRFLALAVPMAEIVARLHARGVIHRDVSPANFILTERAPGVALIDFESATAVPAFAEPPGAPGELEGTLAYMPPEQTGQGKRVVDYRADLYALGATFYEMLTGQPPFPSRDPLEVVHAHAAQAPHAPALVTPTVPVLLSDIVLKLLAKMPAWRYQTATALAADLAEAARQWQARREIAPFELAEKDLPYGLLVADRLYGRERERRALDDLLARVEGGSAEVFFVAGGAGIGKSALVAALREDAEGRCQFIAGKGDQLRGNVPYAPLVEAFRGLVQALLRERPATVTRARDAIARAVGPNGRVLTDAIPDLRTLLGEQPPVPEVGSVESENRFHLAFAALVRALVATRGPLVLFVDDLQWVDEASLELLCVLATDPEARALCVLGAYRTEEVGPGHFVAATLAHIRTAGVRVETLVLGPLDTDALTALLCDALRVAPSRAAPLAAAVRRKTAGNPFFVRQFLGYLYRRQLLVDAGQGQWSWDLAGIDAAEVTPNVVDLLAHVIASLPAPVQRALSAAACIGNRFELGVLAGVEGEPIDEVARTLWPPIREGLLVPAAEGPRFSWVRAPVELGHALAPTYRFVHDRVQQAAYERLDADARKALHLRIGRWLADNVPADEREAAVDAIADQLDRAVDKLAPAERLELARLNERAARQARAAAAFPSALRYEQAGLALLPDEAWRGELHELWLTLQRSAAECAALTGDDALSERLIEEGIARCDAPLEKAALHEVGVRMNAMRGAHQRSIAHALAGLRLLGTELPAEPPPELVQAEKRRVLALLEARSPRQLLEAPPLEDPVDRARLRILVSLTAGWFVAPALFELGSFLAAELTATRGLVLDVRGSSVAYAGFGVALAIEGDYETAYRYCRLGAQLAERSHHPAAQARALLYLGGHVGPWRAPLADSVAILRRAFARGSESGDLEFAAYALSNLVSVRMLQGAPLDQVLVDLDATRTFDRAHHPSGLVYITPVAQAVKCLKGLTRGTSLDDDEFDEARFLGAPVTPIGPAMLHVVAVQTAYLLGDRARAIEWAERAPAWLPALRNLPHQVELHFYAALALAGEPRRRVELVAHLERLETWAEHAPANFAHKRELVRAELARADGNDAEALTGYQRAIEAAAAHNVLQDEALAHELCGRFHAARGRERMAALHLAAAADGYARWGATAKLTRLYAEFPTLDLAGRRHAVSPPPAPPGLDYLTLLKVTETLTDELDLDRLLQKLVRICTEAAHGQRGVLVLDEDGPVVRASASADGVVTLERTPLYAARGLPISIVEHVFARHELVLLGDAARAGRFSDDPFVAAENVRSVLAVPICRKERTLAVFYVENNLASDAFSPERGEMFRLLSVELAIALENSRLFAERKRSEAALRLVAGASARLAETLDYDRVVAAVGAIAVPALADWCMVEAFADGALQPVASAHVDPRGATLLAELRARYPADADAPLRSGVLRSGRARLIAEVTDAGTRSWVRDQDQLRLVHALQPRSLMVVPLIARGRTLGVATFGSSTPERRYGYDDLAVAEELGRRIAIAIENATLHRDLQAALRERERRDRYLRLIFRSFPGAVWALDRDLRFTHANGRFFGAANLGRRGRPGSTLYDFLGTRDPTDPSLAHHLAALAGRRQSFEYQLAGRWYSVEVEPLRDRDKRVIGCVGVAFDVTEKRAAGERLAQSEARLSAAQAVAHIGSFELDPQTGALSCSDEMLRIHGIDPARFGGRLDDLLATVHADDLEATKSAIFDRLRTGGPFTWEHRIVRNGEVRVLHTRGDVQKDATGAPVRVMGTSWDVTDITEANRERERTLSLLGATIEATADGIVAVDRAHDVTVYNRRFLDMWRVPAALAERRKEAPLLTCMREQLEDPDAFGRSLEARDARPEVDSIDLLRLRDGRVFERYARPQRIGDAVVGTVASFRDISERERLLRRALFLADVSRLLVSLDVEQALAAAAHMAVPFLGDGCAIDLFGDRGPRRLVAVSAEPGRPIAAELHPSVLGGNPTIYDVGGVSYLGVPLLMKGHLGGAITVCAPPHRRYGARDLDLVEELARRAALAVENAHLYRQSQDALRARDEFLAIAAHEIRGPATSIHLAVQSLQQAVLPRNALPKLLRIIEHEDRRLAQFVNELLDLGRMRGGLRLVFEEVDLVAVVREVTARFGPELSRSGSPLTVSAPGAVVGQWDRFRLDQVVSNLVANAIKFGLGKPIEVEVRARDDRAVVAVRDHGIGMARDVRGRVFQPFERGVSVRHYGGLGLGLHIVKTIVEAMGGSVAVESEPGLGSTFTVALPLGRT